MKYNLFRFNKELHLQFSFFFADNRGGLRAAFSGGVAPIPQRGALLRGPIRREHGQRGHSAVKKHVFFKNIFFHKKT